MHVVEAAAHSGALQALDDAVARKALEDAADELELASATVLLE